jgi:endonuclease
MRLIVARCEVSYIGRTTTVLPEAVRLLMLKADGTFMVWADGGSPNVRPLNWMTPPTVLEERRAGGGGFGGEEEPGSGGEEERSAGGVDGGVDGASQSGDTRARASRAVEDVAADAATAERAGVHDGSLEHLTVRKQRSDERLEIEIVEVIADIDHPVDDVASLEKEGLERELQELLAAAPQWCGEGFRLVRREWPTDIGPVDLMCRDREDGWVAVEIKRIATMESVRQLTRYLERIRLDPAMASCRGVLVAKWIKPQARVLAAAEDIACVEIDVEVLRGNREPELTLFAA